MESPVVLEDSNIDVSVEDFVWVETEPIPNSNDTEDISNYEDKGVNLEEEATSADDDQLLLEQQYWEHCDNVSKKFNNSKPKYASRQRLTLKEIDMIEKRKPVDRRPSYYQFDKSTTYVLKLLIDKNAVGNYHNIVGYGKNSVVIHADCAPSKQWSYVPGLAVKVYNLTDDSQRNDTIFKRVKNEHNNLALVAKSHKVGIAYVTYKCRNVIVTWFIGLDQETAPTIISLPPKRSEEMYKKLVKVMDECYNELDLVHGRLSTKNILYWYGEIRIIGWGHSVSKDHPLALRKLMRDCHFITQFFEKRGVIVVVTKEELFKKITGSRDVHIKAPNRISKKDSWQGRLTNPNKDDTCDNKLIGIGRFET